MIELPERTDGEVASQSISVTVGGQPVSLPVLRIGRNREWVQQFKEAIDDVAGGIVPIDSMGGLAMYGALTLDRMGELVKSYDESGALGPGYPDSAYPAEVYQSFRKVLSAAFPFGNDLGTLLPQLRAVLIRQIAALAASSPSTNGSHPTTAGPRRRSSKN